MKSIRFRNKMHEVLNHERLNGSHWKQFAANASKWSVDRPYDTCRDYIALFVLTLRAAQLTDVELCELWTQLSDHIHTEFEAICTCLKTVVEACHGLALQRATLKD